MKQKKKRLTKSLPSRPSNSRPRPVIGSKRKSVAKLFATHPNQRKSNEDNFLKSNYKKSWNYVKESRNFIYFMIGLFLIFVLIGFLIPAPPELTKQILEYIQNLVKQTEGMNALELTNFIFVNNLQSSFFSFIFGFFFGIFPILAAIANGYLVGFVAALTISENSFFVLWRLLPHGIFELPAIFISLGFGLRLGSFIFAKKKKQAFVYYVVEGFRAFLFIILPLLIIAAIVEGSLIAFLG